MDLLNLKPNIFNLIENAFKEELPSITFNIQILNLFNHVNFLKNGPVCYLKLKNSGKEFLAHGAFEIFETLPPTKNLDDDQFIFGAEEFPSDKGTNKKLESFFFRPIIVYQKLDNINTEVKIYLDYNKIKNKNELTKFILHVFDLLDFERKKELPKNSISEIIEVPEIDSWKAYIDKITKSIDKSQKVVLSRKKIISFKHPIALDEITNHLYETDQDNQYIFLLKKSATSSFISVSPEKLFSSNNQNIYVDCIAGTRARGTSKHEDQILEKQLIDSEKERNEHLFVANFIQEKLVKLCKDVTMTKAFDILKLKKVQHLHSEFKGTIGDDASSVDFLNLLHPTPAVAGTPTQNALQTIYQLEKSNRGLYAGACGIASKNFTEFLVGIRSIAIEGNTVNIYGGAGIVNQSNYLQEWNETENKMQNFSFLWSK